MTPYGKIYVFFDPPPKKKMSSNTYFTFWKLGLKTNTNVIFKIHLIILTIAWLKIKAIKITYQKVNNYFSHNLISFWVMADEYILKYQIWWHCDMLWHRGPNIWLSRLQIWSPPCCSRPEYWSHTWMLQQCCIAVNISQHLFSISALISFQENKQRDLHQLTGHTWLSKFQGINISRDVCSNTDTDSVDNEAESKNLKFTRPLRVFL